MQTGKYCIKMHAAPMEEDQSGQTKMEGARTKNPERGNSMPKNKPKEEITITNTGGDRWHVAVKGSDESIWYGGPYNDLDEAFGAARRGHEEIVKMIIVRKGSGE